MKISEDEKENLVPHLSVWYQYKTGMVPVPVVPEHPSTKNKEDWEDYRTMSTIIGLNNNVSRQAKLGIVLEFHSVRKTTLQLFLVIVWEFPHKD